MLKHILSLGALIVLLTGCATRKDMGFPPNFLSQPSSIVITKVSGLEEPYLYKKESTQGLLDVIINKAATDSVCEKIQRIDASSVLEEKYYKPFDQVFNKYAFKVINDYKGLHKKQLAKAPNDDVKFVPHDFASLKHRFNVDYALILHPVIFGANRQYYGFIPLGAPKGHAHIHIYLVDLANNQLIGYYNSAVTTIVKDEWDNPPEYKSLIDACKLALADAIDHAYGYFFIGR